MRRPDLFRLLLCGIAGTCTSAFADPPASTVGPFTEEEYRQHGAGNDNARPFVINITGATLMENFIRAPASTNDYLDIDGDGRTVPSQIDNLAGVLPGNPYNSNLWWIVHYRVVGSVNGYQELLDYGLGCSISADIGDQTGATTVQNNPPADLSSDVCQLAYVNSQQYIVNGQPGGPAASIYNLNNPGATPVRSYCNGSNPVGKRVYSGVVPFNSSTGGYRADIAPIDVPSSWGTTVPGTPGYNDSPFEIGYGLNPRLNVNKDGSTFIDPAGNPFGFKLVTVVPPLNLFNPSLMPDEYTVFDTDFAYTPVAAITNLGTGYQTISYTRQRHMLTTGRTENGENLVQVTRDTGSGTHNAYVNSFCIDPSHGVGEAIGGLSSSAQEQLAGPFFIPGNKAGSSGVEATCRNTRLGITYSGAERGVNSAWLTSGRLECLGVLNDVQGGTVAARPTIANVLGFQTIDFVGPPFTHTVLANRYNGYNIGGPGVMATIGDARSELNVDSFGNPILGTDIGNTNPPLRNPQAAAYLNNITRSTEDFVALGPDPLLFSPGEFLAQTLIINGSRAYTQDGLVRAEPCNLIRFDEMNGVPKVDSLVATVAQQNTLAHPAYTSFGQAGLNGRTPTRFILTGTNRYSDCRGTDPAGPDDFRNYIRQGGTTVGYDNADIRNRNRIAGDFNGDGLRNWNDAEHLVRAYWDRINRPNDIASFNDASPTNWVAPNGTGAIAGAPGSDAIIEVLGDFNCDGNFGRIWNDATQAFNTDTSDLRYWADGLALDPATGKLNRCEGFTRLDNAWRTVSGNPTGRIFGTVLATEAFGAVYMPGAAAADVAGPSGLFTPNFQPIGHDGVVDARDIDYVRAQFRRNPHVSDGELNWDNTAPGDPYLRQSEAQFAINSRGEVVGNLSCDVNGDLKINEDDVLKIFDFLHTTPCDVNLDRFVDGTDRAIIEANIGNMNAGFAQGDVNGDGIVDISDLEACFQIVPLCCPGNADKLPGQVNFADITAVLTNFNLPVNPNGTSPGDADCNGAVNFADVTSVLTNFLSVCD